MIFQGEDAGPFAQGVSVYVDPGSASVVGTVDDAATFMWVVRTIHGELMAGTVGDRVVETAACWALILVATGTYLWWTSRGRRPARSSRARLRRLHALTGAGAVSCIRRAAAQTLHVDQYSGRVLVSYGWEEYGILAKGVALHEGRRYGTVNLLVMPGR